MKKNYIKPEIKEVVTDCENTLLVGSGNSINVTYGAGGGYNYLSTE